MGGVGGHVPPKIRERKFFGQFLCQIRAFSGKNHVKLGNFVNFSGKCHKNQGGHSSGKPGKVRELKSGPEGKSQGK